MFITSSALEASGNLIEQLPTCGQVEGPLQYSSITITRDEREDDGCQKGATTVPGTLFIQVVTLDSHKYVKALLQALVG
jgi:hypothetical protein